MKRISGFTLIELMVVIAVIAFLITAAVPAVNSYQTRHGLQFATDELYGDVQLARMRAARNNQRCRITFNQPGPGQYQIDDLDNAGAFIGIFKISNLAKFRGGIRFANSPNAADPAPLISFQFLAQGIVDPMSINPANSDSVYFTNQDNDPFFRVFISLAGGTGIDRWIPAQNKWQ